MKKKLLLTVLAFVCAITCAIGLAACNNGNSAKIDFLYITDGTNNDFAGQTTLNIETSYGEALDLTKYKLFLHDTSNDTKEVFRTDEKFTVKYYTFSDDEYKEITALPDDMITGSYKIEYVYNEKAELKADANYELKAEVNISVVQSQSGNFTVQPILTTWQSQGTRSKVIVRNPKGAEVKSNGGTTFCEKTNDTDGYYVLYLFEKSVYDGFTEAQKKDNQFLDDYWSQDNDNKSEHEVYAFFDDDDNFVRASAGEYILLASIGVTYNYRNIVTPAVQITVTAQNGQ